MSSFNSTCYTCDGAAMPGLILFLGESDRCGNSHDASDHFRFKCHRIYDTSH
jgi:hypothetical protein